MNHNIGIIIQARMGSTRLPGKIMLNLCGKTVLQHVFERCSKTNVDEVIVATTIRKQDDIVVDFCEKNNIKYFRGSEEDVLDRYYWCAKTFNLDEIIRVTSDCPLIDFNILNKLIELYRGNNYDYGSNVAKLRTFPRGYDCEIFSFKILELMWNDARSKSEREHVTKYIINNQEKFKLCHLYNDIDYSKYRLTLDEEDDFKLLRIIFEKLYPSNNYFGLDDVLKFLHKNSELIIINQHVEQKKL